MRFAIWFACLHRQAAEPEVICSRVAHWPFACLLSQFHQADTLGLLFDFANLGQGFWADLVCRRLRRQRLTSRNNCATCCGNRDSVFVQLWLLLCRFGCRRGRGLWLWWRLLTALRVTPPSSLAIWLADWPSPHIFFSVSTRSSVQDMFLPLAGALSLVNSVGPLF